jgi:hypothetical protein
MVRVRNDLAGGGVDEAHVEIVDEHDHGGSVEGSSEADVVESAGDAEGHVAGVDAVASDAQVWAVGAGRGGFGTGRVGGVRGRSVWQRAVRSLEVVDLDEPIELVLQGVDGGRGELRAEPLLDGLVEAFDLAAGGRVIRAGVLLDDAERIQQGLEAVAAASAAGQAGGEDHPVVVNVEAGIPWVSTAVVNAVTTIGPVTRRWAVTDRA